MSLNPDIRVSGRIPVQGELRFVSRDEETAKPVVGSATTGKQVKTTRILQQYQWSKTEHKFDWYDIPLAAVESYNE